MLNWPTKKLGEVCEIITGSTPRTSVRDYYGGDILWAGPTDLDQGDFVIDTQKKLTQRGVTEGGARLVPKGSIMVSCIGYIGKVSIASRDMATNQQINTFFPKIKDLDSKYLFYALVFKSDKFKNLSSQTTLPIINKTKCSNIEISLPPIGEQRKIVAKLERILGKIKEAKKLRVQARENADNLLSAELHKIFEEGKKKDWEEKELDGLIDTITPPVKIQKKDFKQEGRYPVIDQSQNEISGWTNDVGSLVGVKNPVVIFGDHTCAVKYSDKPFAQGADGIKILSTRQSLLARFLYLVLKNRPVKLEGYRRHFAKLKKYKILLPPLVEQKKIVARLDRLSEKIRQLQEYQKKTESDLIDLEQSVLHRAFAGKL